MFSTVFLDFLYFQDFEKFWTDLAMEFEPPARFSTQGSSQIQLSWNFKPSQVDTYNLSFFCDFPSYISTSKQIFPDMPYGSSDAEYFLDTWKIA